MVAKYGRAKQRPLSATQTQSAMKRHDIVCAHTMVGNLKGTDGMFHDHGFGGTESHYGIGGKWGPDRAADLDGEIYQWQDRAHTADANFNGNPRIISVETADNAPKSAKDIEEWTPKQVAALVDLIAWECSLAAHQACPSTWTCHKGVVWGGVRVAIPPVLVPDSKSTRRGLAVHRQGVTPSAGVGKLPGYRVFGGEEWSTKIGKECPGDRRVKQFKEEVIPAVQARLRPKKPTVPTIPEKEDDDVTKQELKDAIIEVLKDEKIVPNTPTAAQLKANPDLKVTYFSVVGALSNVEFDQDTQGDTGRVDVTAIKAMLAALLAQNAIPLPDGVKP